GTGSTWGGADAWMVRASFLGWSGCNQFAVSTTQTSPTDPTYTTLNRTVASLPVSPSNLISQLIMPLSYTICTNNPTVSEEEMLSNYVPPGFYPNPTSGIIHFRDLNSSSLHYAFYNQLGKCVDKGQAINSVELDSSLPNGIYFLELSEKERVFRYKLVLER
ncbi:MAG: T9SS type A sorting domain-containing protein, partial [Bacteroidia bacterium]|nr:T9SS type A sorting domain-containing protein [Bacteroidia bacterium]